VKGTIVFACLFFCLLLSCKSDEALKFSNIIVEKYDQLLDKSRITDSVLKIYLKENDFDSIVAVSGRMEDYTDIKLNEINQLTVPAVSNAEAFKTSVTGYFTYIKSIYTGYKSIGLSKPGKDRKTASGIVKLILSNKDSVVAQMQRIQRAYASSNGFKIK